VSQNTIKKKYIEQIITQEKKFTTTTKLLIKKTYSRKFTHAPHNDQEEFKVDPNYLSSLTNLFPFSKFAKFSPDLLQSKFFLVTDFDIFIQHTTSEF